MERRTLLKNTLGFLSAGLVLGKITDLFTKPKPKLGSSFDPNAATYNKVVIVGGKYDHCTFRARAPELIDEANVHMSAEPEKRFLELREAHINHLTGWTLVHVDNDLMFRNRKFMDCIVFTRYLCYCETDPCVGHFWWNGLKIQIAPWSPASRVSYNNLASVKLTPVSWQVSEIVG